MSFCTFLIYLHRFIKSILKEINSKQITDTRLLE